MYFQWLFDTILYIYTNYTMYNVHDFNVNRFLLVLQLLLQQVKHLFYDCYILFVYINAFYLINETSIFVKVSSHLFEFKIEHCSKMRNKCRMY